MLGRLCRICGTEGDWVKNVHIHKKELEIQNININEDSKDIHPQFVCNSCHAKLNRNKTTRTHRSKGSKIYLFKKEDMFSFTPCEGGKCKVCAIGMKMEKCKKNEEKFVKRKCVDDTKTHKKKSIRRKLIDDSAIVRNLCRG